MSTTTLQPPTASPPELAPQVEPESPSANEPPPKQIIVEADEIVFRAGEATITLSKSEGGIVDIHAPMVRLTGVEILSEAEQTHTTAGRRIVSEAISVSELLGRLIRIDGQCVKIS